jgi:hypothetical protein
LFALLFVAVRLSGHSPRFDQGLEELLLRLQPELDQAADQVFS